MAERDVRSRSKETGTHIASTLSTSKLKNRLLAALPGAERERYFSGLRRVTLSQRDVLQEAAAPISECYRIDHDPIVRLP